MDKLTTEQKAQRYNEALERAKGVIEQNPLMEYLKKGIEYILPELKESEDERVRKEVKSLFLGWINGSNPPLLAEECNRWIAWLEKQGEHANFRNKIQIGDKVTRNEDGVLVNLSQLNRVAKKNEKQEEQKPNPCDGCINRKGCINCENGELREIEQNPAWSEEDNKLLELTFSNLIEIKNRFGAGYGKVGECIDWLTSLKDRVQLKQEWSEEDEDAIGMAIIALDDMYNPDEPNDTYAGHSMPFDKAAERLKSLRERYAWKPSDEQIIALKQAKADACGKPYFNALCSLYIKLKGHRKKN